MLLQLAARYAENFTFTLRVKTKEQKARQELLLAGGRKKPHKSLGAPRFALIIPASDVKL